MPFTSKVFLVRPSRFGYNPQTAASNAFQKPAEGDPEEAARAAAEEFDSLAAGLEALGVEVVISEDPPKPRTPDAVFPNNWFSTHPDKTLFLYPMESETRRLERHPDHIERIIAAAGTRRVVDLTCNEAEGRYLEGTGSLVVDGDSRTAYACVSSRTDPGLAAEWAEMTGHELVLFRAAGPDGVPVYHTNVVMCVGEGFAVVCLDSIADERERNNVRESLARAGKTVIPITLRQMADFAGNMLQLRTSSGGPLLVMSDAAERSLTAEQRGEIERRTGIASFSIPTIETCGGGSVRCMIAELF